MNYFLGFFQKIFSQIQGFFTFLVFRYKKSLQTSIFWKIVYNYFPKIFEKIQLFLIYFLYYFNFMDLFYLKAKGSTYPIIFLEFLKINIKLLDIPLFAFLCNPENTFFLHLIITQIVMQRKQILFTDLVKFHIVTLTLVDSLNRLALDYINFFSTRDLVKSLPSKLGSSIYLYIFGITIFFYIYSYICGLFSFYPKFPPPYDIITKSAFFWLKKKKKLKKEKKETLKKLITN